MSAEGRNIPYRGLERAYLCPYNGNQIIEVRNGADDVELLVVHGTRYIDEIVCQRVKDRGWAYVHQDANWNVTALTAMNGAVIERYWYKPYGAFVAAAEYGWFDYDQDGDVDGTDVAAAGLGGACWQSSSQACLCLDADGDGKVEYDDYAIISDYVSTLTADTQLQRVPAARSTRRGNPFAHQGLLYDAEIASFQNRARQYDPKMRRFMQRDPLAILSVEHKGVYRILPQSNLRIYQYAGNNPTSWKDPSGLQKCHPCQNRLNDLFENDPIIGYTRTLIDMMGCQQPKPVCKRSCGGGVNGRFFLSQPGNTPTACVRGAAPHPNETLRHEVWHAFQHCTEVGFPTDCAGVGNWELEAVLVSGRCSPGGSEHGQHDCRTCLVSGCWSSAVEHDDGNTCDGSSQDTQANWQCTFAYEAQGGDAARLCD